MTNNILVDFASRSLRRLANYHPATARTGAGPLRKAVSLVHNGNIYKSSILMF
ncbi:MAG: hypothetical protein ACRC62_31305 [Microcoleus sp.]